MIKSEKSHEEHSCEEKETVCAALMLIRNLYRQGLISTTVYKNILSDYGESAD